MNKGESRSEGPQRKVENNLLTSSNQPATKVRVDDSFTYLGRLQFELYSVAEVEQFIFVHADENKRLRKMLIVQFEGYLPSNDHVYDYPVTDTVTVGSHEYIHDTFVYSVARSLERADSDYGRTLSFIQESGYTLPEEAISSRLVRLLDGRRSEILFFYDEDLAPIAASAEEISEKGRLKEGHESQSEGLLERALKSFEIVED